MIRQPPRSPLFPYTPLSRSRERAGKGGAGTATLAAIQARLDPHTLLLEYWVTPRAAAVVWATRDSSGISRIPFSPRSEEHTSELQSQSNLVCRLLLEQKKSY